MTRKEKISFLIIRTLGNFLVLLSLYGVIGTFGPSLLYEVQYHITQSRGIKYTIATPIQKNLIPSAVYSETPGFGSLLNTDKEQILIPKDTQFSILIPKIGANAKVFPNIDANDSNSFLPILKQGVAHAKGSVFPGMNGNVYLFAHSTDNWWDVGRYNAVFYLLKDLTIGDAITIFFENRRYNYVVNQTIITDPNDVSYLINSHQNISQQIILQTCWPPGTTWKRLFVIASPKVATQ